jgi:hypothetical protein
MPLPSAVSMGLLLIAAAAYAYYVTRKSNSVISSIAVMPFMNGGDQVWRMKMRSSGGVVTGIQSISLTPRRCRLGFIDLIPRHGAGTCSKKSYPPIGQVPFGSTPPHDARWQRLCLLTNSFRVVSLTANVPRVATTPG